MAGKELRYDISVDASDATSSLKGFEKAVRQALRGVEDELDEGASAGDKFSASIDRLTQQMREDFNSAAIAAEELQRALRDVGSQMDVGDALATLQRVGVSFDEVTADADKFATSLKQLDDVRLTGVRDLDTVAPGLATKLNDVSDSAEKSRNALANMVGNAAQDIGAVGGIAGSLGVGIGQLAEGFADATLAGEGFGSAIKGVAAVAGPIAGIALATQLLSTAMAGIQAEKAFRAGLVDQFADDLRDAQTVAESLYDTLKQTGDLEVTVPFSGGFLNLGAEAKSLVGIVDELGLSWNQVVADIKDPNAQDRIRQMTSEMVFQGDEGERLAVLWNDYALGVDQYGDAWRDAAGQQEISNRLLAEAEASGVGEAAAREAAAEATREQAEAAQEAAEAERARRTALLEAEGALAEMSSTMSEIGRRGQALEDLFTFGNAPADAAAATRDIAEAIDGLDEAAEGVDLSGVLDPSNLGADELLDALDGLRPQIQAKVSEAFALGGPEAARSVADGYVAQIVEQLGGQLTPDEVRELLGLGDLEATIDLAIKRSAIERVKSELAVLTGLTGQTPLTASIALALDAGEITPEAAEVLVRAQLGAAGVTIPSTLGPPSSEAAIAEAGAFMTDFIGVPIPTRADPAGFASDASDISAADYAPATVPVEAETKPVDTAIEDVEEADYEATVGVDADTARAAFAILAFLALPRVANIYADLPNAELVNSILNLIARQRVAPIDAYLRDYPTATEIANRIGTVRVPVDAYLRSAPRINGDLGPP